MKIKTIHLYAFCFSLILINAEAQVSSTKSVKTKNDKTMQTTIVSTEPVKAFFNAFGNGNFEGIINSFHDNCTITAVRDNTREKNEIYGTYKGKEGVKEFISNLGNAFNTKAFTVENVIGEGDIAFANGKFTHEIKATNKLYSSDWSLMCKIQDGKILEYHFYEDTAKFAEASMR